MSRQEHPKYAGDVIFLPNGVAKIAARAITADKLALDAIPPFVLGLNSVLETHLATNSVATRHVQNKAITLNKLEDAPEATFLLRSSGAGQGTPGYFGASTAKTILNYASNEVSYNNSVSGMTASTVKGALDELDSRIDGLELAGVDLAGNYTWTGTHVFTQNVTINANLVITGNVDGRNVSADGTKLDTIETNATADQTAGEILAALLTVDTDTSGLNCQFLASNPASYYLDWANTTNKPDPTITVTLTGDVTGTSSATLTDLGSGTVSITTTAAASAAVPISETPPGSPTAGKLWWHSGQGQLKVYYTDVDSSQWVDANAHTGGGGATKLASRGQIVATTASLAHDSTEDMDLIGYKSYALLLLSTDRAARVRIYTDDASRTSDAGRAIGVPVSTEVGLVYEIVTAGVYERKVAPFVIGGNLEDPPVDYLYIAITNRSGSSSTVTVGLTILQLEH